MVKKKGKSKRQTLKQKYKIERRVKEHHRKLKKEANRNKKAGVVVHKAKPKDPGIPNSWPFKDDLLKQIERAKENMDRRREEENERRKELRKQGIHDRRRAALVGGGMGMDQMANDAHARAQQFNATSAGAEDTTSSSTSSSGAKHGQQSRRAYLRELRKVVESSDVILEIVDARDPAGSRATAVEAAIAANPKKKLVLVLNKVDLVPKDVAQGWLAHLRRSYPAVAFKASTQEGSISQAKGVDAHAEDVSESVLQRSAAVGVEALMNVLKNYARSLDIKTSITVGVIGYPNTGKSSLINSLKRSKAVGTSPTPGFTKMMQEVVLDKHIRLLDCPGIVFDDSDGDATLLRNCVDPDTLEDPVAAINAILKRCKADQLMSLYALPRFNKGDADAFLGLVARRCGKVKRGGVPDKEAAARVVLRDWNSGKVPFFTKPPADTAHLVQGAASIVSSFGSDFNVEELQQTDAEMFSTMPDQRSHDFVAFDTMSGAMHESQGCGVAEAIVNSDDDEEMSADHDDDDEEDDDDDEDMQEGGASSLSDPFAEDRRVNPGMGADHRRSNKAALKKMRKNARRRAGYSDQHDASMGGEEEDYNFDQDF